MATKVLVPLLGEGVEEVTVTKWLKKEGDSVNELEPLLEVNTDKVDTEIPAPASGTVLKILAEEGVPAKVGAVLAFIGKPGESVEVAGGKGEGDRKEEKKPSTVSNQPVVQQQPAVNREIGFISPVVAKVAAEHGVNLQQVQGTGMNGRITKNDVLGFVEGQKVKVQTHGDVEAYLPACVDRDGSGYESRSQTSFCKQGNVRARWRQSYIYVLLYVSHRRGFEGVSQCQFLVDG
jgi:2-oxoglutarate dehydrogenase E2 component (dihydrolipoamide succinyltransferase)